MSAAARLRSRPVLSGKSLCVAAAAALWFGSCAAAPDLDHRQWQECRSPTTASLRGLCPLSAMVALVAGSGGMVLRTLDGGASWEPIGPRGAGTLDFRSLAAPDPQHLTVASAGAPARIYASDDGGGHWRLAHEDAREAAFFDTVVVDGNGRGFALGDPIDGHFVLLCTRDFGASWSGVEAPAAAAGEAAFAASNGCLCLPGPRALCVVTGGAASRALISDDDGAHWSATPLPISHGQPSQGAFAVAFADPLHGVAVGGDYGDAAAPGAAAFTDDGGRSWQAAQIAPAGYRSGVAALPNSRTFLAVGPAGSSISRDGGRSWQAFGALGFHTVRAAPDGALWAAGSGGRIARLR